MKDIYRQLELFFLCLTAFVFPLYIKLTSFTLVILFIASFILKENRQSHINLLKNPKFYLFILPIIIALLGLLNADNFSRGINHIVLLSSLLLFPFIFSSLNQNNYPNKYQLISSFFILGIITAFLLCISSACLNYAYVQKKSVFFYATLSSNIMSPNHLSFYVLWAIILILHDISEISNTFILYRSKIIKYIILVTLIIFLFLLSSKAGFLIFCIISLSFIFFVFVRKKIAFWKSLIVLVIFFSAGIYLYQTTTIKDRLQYAINYTFKIYKNEINLKSESQESTALRISAIKKSYKLINDNFWLGVGTGDVQQNMLKLYNDDEQSGAYIQQTNPHNQFLYSFIMNGIFGFSALLLMFGVMIRCAVKQKDSLLLFWSVFMFFLFFTDDILSIQIGVVFFSFFSSLFIFRNKKPIITNEI